MVIGVFTDKTCRPSEAEIEAMIGPCLPLWRDLISFIRATYPADEDFTFLYGKKYGWALRFRLKGKLLLSLYPAEKRFIAQINLRPAAVEQAQQLTLGANACAAISRATPYPEGRWLFIPVESGSDAADIRRLLSLRVATRLK